MPRRLTIALLLGLAVLTAVAGVDAAARRPVRRAAPAPAPPPAPPPGLTAEDEAFSRRLAAAAAQDGALNNAGTGVVVLDLATGKTLLDWRGDVPLVPASNMKVVTGAAALSILHPEYTWKTGLYATGPVEGGVLRGDLVLRGAGDPFLVPENLYLIAGNVASLGIREIAGDLVGDHSRYDPPGRNPTWAERNFDRAFAAPVGALSVNFNVATVLTRATTPGQAPEVRIQPFGDGIPVDNLARTSTRGGDFTVARRLEPDGRARVVVSGQFPASSGPSEILVPVEDPTLYALSGFRAVLQHQGVSVRGGLRADRRPPGARELTFFESKPLSLVVRDMNKVSSNFIAEMLLKEIGAEQGGEPGTTEKGAAAVLGWLRERGIDTTGLVLRDGSGLSPEDRITARALARILRAAALDPETGPEFVVSLPVGGVDGTLEDRMEGDARRRVRAKTGRIAGATSLSGYAYSADGSTYAFSVLANDSRTNVWKVHRAMDRLCDALVAGRASPGPLTETP